MGILGWIIFGLIVGALAKWIMPGRDPSGIFITILLGIAGTLIGGFIASALGMGSANSFTIGSMVIATLGALLLLFVYRKMRA